MEFIFDLIRKLPNLLQMLAGKAKPEIAGKIKQRLKPKQKEYMTYLVAVRYNQKHYQYGEVDRYSRNIGVGLASYVKDAILMVKANPSLIDNKKIRRQFIHQPVIRCAKALCSSVIRYIWMEMVGVDLPTFADWYIKCVAKGYITYDKKDGYCWVANSKAMISDFMVSSKYWEFEHNVNFTNVTAMVNGFLSRREKVGLVRKGTRNKNTHTYLVSKFAGQVIMFDTWHSRYTGHNITTRHPKPDSLWWIYGY